MLGRQPFARGGWTAVGGLPGPTGLGDNGLRTDKRIRPMGSRLDPFIRCPFVDTVPALPQREATATERAHPLTGARIPRPFQEGLGMTECALAGRHEVCDSAKVGRWRSLPGILVTAYLPGLTPASGDAIFTVETTTLADVGVG